MWNSFPVILKEAFDFTSDSPKKKAPVSKWDVHRDLDGSKVTTYIYIGNIWIWENFPLCCKWVFEVFSQNLILKWIKTSQIKGQVGGEIASTRIRQPISVIPKPTALGIDPTAVRGSSVASQGRLSSTSQHHHHPQQRKGDKISCMSNKQISAVAPCPLTITSLKEGVGGAKGVGGVLSYRCLEAPCTLPREDDASYPMGLRSRMALCPAQICHSVPASPPE